MPLRKFGLFSSVVLLSILFTESCVIGNSMNLFPPTTKSEFEEKLIAGKDQEKIVIIPIEGMISDEGRESFFGPSSDSMVVRVKESLKRAERDPDVKGVILKINSPGGTVTASDIIYQEIKKFKERKGIPVFAGFMDTAASGAYYIAMATDSIGAHPTTVTGSVGVIMSGINVKEGLDKIGIKDQSFTSGPNKALGSPTTEMTAEQRKILQSIIDSLYARFFDVVKKGRPKVSETRLKEICDGRIFTAEQAQKEGMIDDLFLFGSGFHQIKLGDYLLPERVLGEETLLDGEIPLVGKNLDDLYVSKDKEQSFVGLFSMHKKEKLLISGGNFYQIYTPQDRKSIAIEPMTSTGNFLHFPGANPNLILPRSEKKIEFSIRLDQF